MKIRRAREQLILQSCGDFQLKRLYALHDLVLFDRFKIYVNLFIVMGITWIAEALSMHIGPKKLW